MSTPDNLRHVAALARAVALLRQSPEPGAPQKDALRALVGIAAERSATFRFYDGTLTLDGAVVPTTDPRLAALTEGMVAQHVAEVTIAREAGPDELLALTLGLAAGPGLGRVKERLRDAGSARVMVVLQQYDQHAKRSVSDAFEKVSSDRGVMADWNEFHDQSVEDESERVAHSRPSGQQEGDLAMRAGAPPAAPAAKPPAVRLPSAAPAAPAAKPPALRPPATAPAAPAAKPPAVRPPLTALAAPAAKPPPAHPVAAQPPPPVPSPPAVAPRAPRPSSLQERQAITLEAWFVSFELGMKNRFPDHFGDADWHYRIDRAAGTVSASDSQGRSTVSVRLPKDHLEASAFLVAGKLLHDLRMLAEKEGAIRKRR